MKALSIRQPWAWLIIHAGKDIENRTWATTYRGPLLIHAAKGMTLEEYKDARDLASVNGVPLPPMADLQRGGIIGQVDLVMCADFSNSPWWAGPVGFVLANPKPLPFHPCKGALGLFNVELL